MHSYLHTASAFLQDYNGTTPLHLALKQFFNGQKKYGSRDRRWISELCFAYMRTSRAFTNAGREQVLLAGLLLTRKAFDATAAQLFARSGWEVPAALYPAGPEEKQDWMRQVVALAATGSFFPLTERLSPLGSLPDFLNSHLRQPAVWLRIRRQRRERVLAELDNAGIVYRAHAAVPQAIALSPGVKLDQCRFLQNGDAEIQDLSSQQTLNGLQPLPGEKWLDACAASGGKSLLLLEQQPALQLTVCDVRSPVLQNLDVRFKRNGVHYAEKWVADLTMANVLPENVFSFDGILADVPCSGSGTWSRTPEQMHYFTAEKLQDYCTRQRAILKNLVRMLKPGGTLVYITCSVYRDENEAQVAELLQTYGLSLVQAGLLEGYTEEADTMFAAVLVRP